MHEASMHKHNSYVTLTLADENLRDDRSLDHQLHFAPFIKRLAERVKYNQRKGLLPSASGLLHAPSAHQLSRKGIAFYMCGEYGTRTRRPHYHACIFGVDFADREYYKKNGNGDKLYTSATLADIWRLGNTITGDVTYQSAGYVARYIMQKQTGENEKIYEILDIETGEIIKQKPEYNCMSRNPGIGRPWLMRYAADAYPTGKIIVRGSKMNTPRYYDNVIKEMDPVAHDMVRFGRELEAATAAAENTPARLKARETVLKAKLKLLPRGEI